MTVSVERLQAIVDAIESIPPYSPERYEAEAFMYMTIARSKWRVADRLRQVQREREARERRRQERKT